MNIEAIVKKHVSLYRVKAHHSVRVAMRAALTELSETHAIEMREYEATVQNLEGRIQDMGAKLQVLRNQVGKYAEPNDYSPFPWAGSDLRWEHDCRRVRRYARSFSRGIDTCPSCGMSSPFPAAPQPKKENSND